jgi:uncharacterized membrane protein
MPEDRMEDTKRAPSYGQCFASLGLGLAPFFLIVGLFALFGANTVTSGGQNIHGIGGLLVAIILNVVFAAVFAGLQKLGYVILALIQRARPQTQV